MFARSVKMVAIAGLASALLGLDASAESPPAPISGDLKPVGTEPLRRESIDTQLEGYGAEASFSNTPTSNAPATNPTSSWDKARSAPNSDSGWEGFSQPTSPYRSGTDLRQVVEIFVNESLAVGANPQAVNYDELYEAVLARQSDPNSPAAEYEVIRETLARYGQRSDRLLTPDEFSALLNQPRQPVQSRSLAAGVTMLTLDDITPATAQQIRQSLHVSEYSRGIVLDLRGATGYDPQAIANVARIFLPRSMRPALVSLDRHEKETAWDSKGVPIAARIPLVALVDGQTERGAVILAALLGARGNATIAGEPTAGTETQTRFFVLPSGAAIELAVARWRPGADAGFGPNTLVQGLVPSDSLNGFNVQSQALALLPEPPVVAAKPTIFQDKGRIGRYELGFDTRQSNIGDLGGMDTVPSRSGENIFQPDSDLRVFYLQDYILLAYRNQGTLSSFFADRIYMTDTAALTEEGVSIGASYSDVVSTYGSPGENGYNEVSPFPGRTRIARAEDRYFINYDALGLSFAFEAGTNQVVAIGLYKPGS
ncbi:MAG: S41 family peptidase [Cyanobacteria bacterium P01_F01_bin.33]